MQAQHIAIILGLSAAIGWGFSGFFDAKASRLIHPIVASFVVNGIITLLYIAGYFVFFHQQFTISSSDVAYAASGGVAIAIGALAYFKALHIGKVSLVSPTSSAYPLITTLVAVAFFGKVLSIEQAIAIVLISFGILAVTEFLSVISKKAALNKGTALGLLTALCWGIGYALVAQAVQSAGWQQATLVEFIAMMIAFLLAIPLLKERHEFSIAAIKQAAVNKHILLASGIALIASVSFNSGFAYDTTGGAVVATFSAFYPILTVALAFLYFKESIKKIQLAGILASISGVILLASL